MTPKEKPILFSTPMVQALLNTKLNTWPPEPVDPAKPYKGMTRRVMKEQPDDDGLWNHDLRPMSLDSELTGWRGTVDATGESREFKPKYQPGDLVYVRETFCSSWSESQQQWLPMFKADGGVVFDEDGPVRWQPSIHMPKKYARIWLECADVKAERLNEISEGDAVLEGVSEELLINIIKSGAERAKPKPCYYISNGDDESIDYCYKCSQKEVRSLKSNDPKSEIDLILYSGEDDEITCCEQCGELLDTQLNDLAIEWVTERLNNHGFDLGHSSDCHSLMKVLEADGYCSDRAKNMKKICFSALWQSIHGPESWEANPWVWAYSFRVISTTGKPSAT